MREPYAETTLRNATVLVVQRVPGQRRLSMGPDTTAGVVMCCALLASADTVTFLPRFHRLSLDGKASLALDSAERYQKQLL